MIVSDVDVGDAPQLAEIYNHYIATSSANFELDPVGALEMQRRIIEASAGGYPFLVAEQDGEIGGYAYASPFKSRPAYKHSAEVSVYIRASEVGKGIATKLYGNLIPRLENREIHTVIAGISLRNEPSVRLHERFGFRQVAHFHEVGRKFDRWIDVGYWQLILSLSGISSM